MLPKKLHLEQIERFHKKINDLSGEIEKCKNRGDLKDYVSKLSMQYYKLSKLWIKIDDFVEITIKNELDCIEENN